MRARSSGGRRRTSAGAHAGMGRVAVVAILSALALLALPGVANANHGKNRVYVFVVDGLDPAVIGTPATPFISSLAEGGEGARSTLFTRSRSVMVAETNPNHTAMITGTSPRRSGITGNEFAVYGPIPDDDSCSLGPLQPGKRPNATSGESTECLQVPTLFETVERRRNPKHITTALITGKPKLARQLATRNVSSSRYDADHVWAPCRDAEPYCDDKPTNPITGYAASDGVVMDEVIRTTRRGVLDRGRLRQPDFTFVNLPQVDSAGHAFGRTSTPYDTAVLLADAEIRRFVENQKQLGIWERTVMMIVSDHSMDNTPQTSKVRIANLLGGAGIPDDSYVIVGNGSAAHIYLANRRDPGANRLLSRMRTALSGAEGVRDVLYRRPNPADGGPAHSVRHQRPGWGLGGPRAGDIVLTTKRGIGVHETSEASSYPFNPVPGNHGAPHTANNTFLVTGGHPAIRQRTNDNPVSNADVNPTAMRLLNRKRAKVVEGMFRRGAFRVGALPKR